MCKFKTIILLCLLSLFISACNDNQTESSGENSKSEHIWKQQTDALKSAKDVAAQLQESLNQHKQKLDKSD